MNIKLYGLIATAVFTMGLMPQTSYAEDAPLAPVENGYDVDREALKERFMQRWDALYENASDEQREKMDAKRAEFEALSDEEKEERLQAMREKYKEKRAEFEALSDEEKQERIKNWREKNPGKAKAIKNKGVKRKAKQNGSGAFSNR